MADSLINVFQGISLWNKAKNILTLSEYNALLTGSSGIGGKYIDRIEKLNKLVSDSFTDPSAYDRLYNLYNFYLGKLSSSKTSKADYEAYHGL